jgi:DNA gyrase subunit A
MVDGQEELMLVSKKGIAIRTTTGEISSIGRATQGVKIMRIDEGDQLAAAALILSEDEEE